MRTVKCDICGKEILRTDKTAHMAGTPSNQPGLFGCIVRDLNVHAECVRIGRQIDVRALALQAWVDLVGREAAETK